MRVAQSPQEKPPFLEWLDQIVSHLHDLGEIWVLIVGASLLSILTARAAHCNQADRRAELENSCIFFQIFFAGGYSPRTSPSSVGCHDISKWLDLNAWLKWPSAPIDFFSPKTTQRCVVVCWNPKSVCLTKHVSHELKVVSRQCLQRPVHTSTRPLLSAVFAVAHCLHVYIAEQKTNGKLWSLKKKQTWNGISLSFSPTINRRKLIDEPVSCWSVRLLSPCPCAGMAEDFSVCLLF